MTIYLNNQEVEVNEGIALASFLNTKELLETGGIAVAINGRVVPKVKWETTVLNEKDNLMIITATAGG